jgi:SHAQKYF class myb-like DNA-binding protein
MVFSKKEDEDEDTKEASNPSANAGKRKRDQRVNDEEQESSLERKRSQGPWGKDLHRSFVQAIFEIGIDRSSPAVVLKEMANYSKQEITGERAKSRLQKFRKNKEKEKERFVNDYDQFMQKFTSVPPAVLLQNSIGADKPVGGLAAAILSHSVMTTEGGSPRRQRPRSGSSRGKLLEQGLARQTTNYAGFPATKIPPLNLTESEKKTPLGVSLTFLIGLFFHMENIVMVQRATRSTQALPGHAAVTGAAAESSRVCGRKSEVREDEKPLRSSPIVIDRPAPLMHPSLLEHQHFHDATSISSTAVSSVPPRQYDQCHGQQQQHASSFNAADFPWSHQSDPKQPSSSRGVTDSPYLHETNDDNAGVHEQQAAAWSHRWLNVDPSVGNSRKEDDPSWGRTPPLLARDDAASFTSTTSFALFDMISDNDWAASWGSREEKGSGLSRFPAIDKQC